MAEGFLLVVVEDAEEPQEVIEVDIEVALKLMLAIPMEQGQTKKSPLEMINKCFIL